MRMKAHQIRPIIKKTTRVGTYNNFPKYSSHSIKLQMKPISLISPEQTRRHPFNTSPSKTACAFSKGQRFSPPKPECKQAFYLTQRSELSKVKFKIPQSKRSDFTKTLTSSPASTRYIQKSSLDLNKNKGKSFGISRDKSPDRSYFVPMIKKKIPGPGQYETVKQGRSSSNYSLRAKTKDFIGDRLSYKETPGPGAYQQINLNPESGRFRISRFHDAKLSKINPNTKRFLETKYSPGPADYVIKDELNSNASYLLSKDKSPGRSPFTTSPRVNFTQRFRKMSITLPGPFEYSKPSDFGAYGDAKYYRSTIL